MKDRRSHPLGFPGVSGANSLEQGEVSTTGQMPRVLGVDRWLLSRLARKAGHPPVALALWDGENVYTPRGETLGRIVFHDRGALLSTIASPELGFGDAFSAGRASIDGDLVRVLYGLYRANDDIGPNGGKRGFLGRLPKARVNTREGSRDHIHHHYDLGNDFYRLWLDERMVYTCAYYPHPGATLEEAQVAKMHHVCRKVELRPGQRVVEAGCGWGSLALHMARHYGVTVRAFNISHEQVSYAREQAERQGLADRVEFVEDDYRNISGEYDAFVSVGMLEHVGPEHYETLGEVVYRALKDGGRALVHSVGRNRPTAPNAWLERRIFPGSYPPSLREMMDIFEPRNFSILDVENLRLHYARTLVEWLERFDAHVDRITAMYDPTFVRAWRLYLGGCAAAFFASSIQLFQVVFARGADNRVPMTRDHMYGAERPLAWDVE
ncbi:MAG: cyclopropane-fatty-acyl-phospholipid synthase family protein [Gammaproteobacteria bacterium]|nr:cyclopropane-fatty-acyl-phospholipid synthase family protein [Gammaproteobacteria bacterium]